MNNLGNKLEDYENKLAMISQEMLRLNELLKVRQQEIEGFKVREC